MLSAREWIGWIMLGYWSVVLGYDLKASIKFDLKPKLIEGYNLGESYSEELHFFFTMPNT